MQSLIPRNGIKTAKYFLSVMNWKNKNENKTKPKTQTKKHSNRKASIEYTISSLTLDR